MIAWKTRLWNNELYSEFGFNGGSDHWQSLETCLETLFKLSMQQIVCKTKIDNLRKHFKQTRHYFEYKVPVVDAATDQWHDSLRSTVQGAAKKYHPKVIWQYFPQRLKILK